MKMKIVMIGAGIIALTGLNTALANHSFNQAAPAQATMQLTADQDSNTSTMNPAPQTAPQQSGTATPDTNQGQAQVNQNPSTGTMQNNNANPPVTQTNPPAVSAPTTPAEHPVSSQPAENDQNSQNSY